MKKTESVQATRSHAINSPGKIKTSTGKRDNSALQELFVDQLKDIYWAEKHLVKVLPKMQKAATSEQLKGTLEDHLIVTEDQVIQLEKVFDLIGKKAQSKKCEAMEGLLKEGSSIIEETEKGSLTRDVGLIMAAQKVEHYEIATYGNLVQIAKTLHLTTVAGILENILNEEKQADQALTNVAAHNIAIHVEDEREKVGKDEENE